MTKNINLEAAVSKQADSLEPAQREFVMAEFGTYQWNAKKIADIEKQADVDGIDLDEQAKLMRTRHQLVSEQTALFSHIMRWLKGTTAEISELDAFLAS